jgi:hypothetical protein
MHLLHKPVHFVLARLSYELTQNMTLKQRYLEKLEEFHSARQIY